MSENPDARTTNDRIAFLRGERLDGKYAIFPTGGTNWLVHLMREG